MPFKATDQPAASPQQLPQSMMSSGSGRCRRHSTVSVGEILLLRPNQPPLRPAALLKGHTPGFCQWIPARWQGLTARPSLGSTDFRVDLTGARISKNRKDWTKPSQRAQTSRRLNSQQGLQRAEAPHGPQLPTVIAVGGRSKAFCPTGHSHARGLAPGAVTPKPSPAMGTW